MPSDDLTTSTTRLRQATALAHHLADQVDALRSTMPVGYTAGRSVDGTPRPVQDIVEGLDARGVTAAVLTARRLLQQSASLTERACRSLEQARDNWELPTVSER
jgi:hypothetical protein